MCCTYRRDEKLGRNLHGTITRNSLGKQEFKCNDIITGLYGNLVMCIGHGKDPM
jgi:hypothetical protein